MTATAATNSVDGGRLAQATTDRVCSLFDDQHTGIVAARWFHEHVELLNADGAPVAAPWRGNADVAALLMVRRTHLPAAAGAVTGDSAAAGAVTGDIEQRTPPAPGRGRHRSTFEMFTFEADRVVLEVLETFADTNVDDMDDNEQYEFGERVAAAVATLGATCGVDVSEVSDTAVRECIWDYLENR